MSVAVRTPLFVPRRGESLAREAFLDRMRDALVDPRFIFLASPGDHLTSLDESGHGAVITHNASLIGRKTVLGKGIAVTFDGTSHFSTAPDNDRLSFNVAGLTDLPLTVFAHLNVTDTAARRLIISKFNNTAATSEWEFFVEADDHMAAIIRDQSLTQNTSRLADAAVTQGSWHTLAMTYDGSGGALAGNGITFYQDGVLVASTPTNNASYVAMENLGGVLEIGTDTGGTLRFFAGSMAVVTVAGGVRSAAELLNLTNLCRDYFGAF